MTMISIKDMHQTFESIIYLIFRCSWTMSVWNKDGMTNPRLFPVCSYPVPHLFHVCSYSHFVPGAFPFCDTLFLFCSTLSPEQSWNTRFCPPLFQDCFRWTSARKGSVKAFIICSNFVPQFLLCSTFVPFHLCSNSVPNMFLVKKGLLTTLACHSIPPW